MPGYKKKSIKQLKTQKAITNANIQNQILDGQCQFLDMNQGIYTEGPYVNGKKHGAFTIIKPGVYKILAQFVNDECHGPIKILYENNIIKSIEGKAHGQEINGLATITYSNGSIYRGNVKRGLPNGEGHLFKWDGTVYEGTWTSKSKRYAWFEHHTNFKLYVDMCDDKLTVLNKIKYMNGTIYYGYVSNFLLPNGYGKVLYADGSKYIGWMIDGQRQGQGIYLNSNGDYYSGSWKEDKMDGHGLIYDAVGSCIYDMVWSENVPLKFLRSYHY